MKKKRKIKSEINITPLTDVSLMLLSIFLITTPLMVQSGLNVELPKVKNVEKNFNTKSIEIVIDNSGKIYVDKKIANLTELEKEIKSKAKENTSVLIKADKESKYDLIMKVIDISKRAGVTKFALGVETEIEGE